MKDRPIKYLCMDSLRTYFPLKNTTSVEEKEFLKNLLSTIENPRTRDSLLLCVDEFKNELAMLAPYCGAGKSLLNGVIQRLIKALQTDDVVNRLEMLLDEVEAIKLVI